VNLDAIDANAPTLRRRVLSAVRHASIGILLVSDDALTITRSAPRRTLELFDASAAGDDEREDDGEHGTKHFDILTHRTCGAEIRHG
jgi:hypothetical protein